MALPFDIRACASFTNDSIPGDPSPGGALHAGRQRSNRTLVLEPALVVRVQEHDVDAFRELVQLMYAPMVRFAETIVGSRDDAEDVVQDVLTIVWDLGSEWKPSRDPVGYLFTSVRNHALKEIRRRMRATRRAERAHTMTPDSATSSGALDALVDAETARTHVQRVEDVLATLPERQRTVYELRYRRGLTIVAIAEVLQATPKSVEHLAARVALRVAELLRASTLDGG